MNISTFWLVFAASAHSSLTSCLSFSLSWLGLWRCMLWDACCIFARISASSTTFLSLNGFPWIYLSCVFTRSSRSKQCIQCCLTVVPLNRCQKAQKSLRNHPSKLGAAFSSVIPRTAITLVFAVMSGGVCVANCSYRSLWLVSLWKTPPEVPSSPTLKLAKAFRNAPASLGSSSTESLYLRGLAILPNFGSVVKGRRD